MRTRPDKKWPGKYSRFVLSKSIKNLLSFLVIFVAEMGIFFVMYLRRRFMQTRLRHRGFTLTEYTSRNAQEQPSSSMRYLVMRGENHWLASHQQHVRNMACISPSLSVLRNLSFSACWWTGTSYDTTIHIIIVLFATAARYAHVFRASHDR